MTEDGSRYTEAGKSTKITYGPFVMGHRLLPCVGRWRGEQWNYVFVDYFLPI